MASLRPTSSCVMLSLHFRFTILILLLCIVIEAFASPKLILDSANNKCITTHAPVGTILMIHYEAPDLIVDKTDENYGPTYIYVHVIPSNDLFYFQDVDKRMKLMAKELITEKEGVIPHMIEDSGFADICIKASMASRNYPMRFGLWIDRDDSENDDEQQDANHHLSYMELEMKRISKAMKHLVADVEDSKDRDIIQVHQEMKSMHSAAMYWPIIQVCVLLMTSFTQASHITNFFRRRGIV